MLYFFHHYELPLVMHEENVRRLVTNLQNNPNLFDGVQQDPNNINNSNQGQGAPLLGNNTNSNGGVAMGDANRFYATANGRHDNGGGDNRRDASSIVEDDDGDYDVPAYQPISNRERRRLAARRAGERIADNIVTSVLENVCTSLDAAATSVLQPTSTLGGKPPPPDGVVEQSEFANSTVVNNSLTTTSAMGGNNQSINENGICELTSFSETTDKN